MSVVRMVFFGFLAVLPGCSEEVPTGPADAVSIEDVYVSFRDQPAAALQRYQEGSFDITGPIASIEASGDVAELFLQGPSDTIAAVEFNDIDGAQDELATMVKGDVVTVRCAKVRTLGSDMFRLMNCGEPRKAGELH